jgi:hypothetical protein
MKKFVLFVAAAATLGLASCKKDWTCECTYTDSDGATQTTKTDINGKTKKDAEAQCEGKVSAGGVTFTTGSNCNTIKK